MYIKIPNNIICLHDKIEKNLLMYNKKNKKYYRVKDSLFEENDILNNCKASEIYMCNKAIKHLLEEDVLIVSSENNDVALIREKFSELPLDVIQLEVTKRCNFRCVHCFHGIENSPKDIPLEIIKKIVDQASEIGVFEFDITGGEPLLRKDIKDILKYIHMNGMRTRLYTNGFLLNEEFIDFLKEIDIHCVRISVDGIDEKVHDEIRQCKSFQRIMKNIDLLIEKDIDVEIVTVAMKRNYEQMNEIISFFKEKKKIRHFVDAYIPVESEELAIKEEDFAQIMCNKIGDKCTTLSLKERHCGIAYNYVYINVDMNLQLCPMLKNEIIELFYDGVPCLKKAWKKLKEKYSNLTCENISNCSLGVYCGGGCRARAFYKTKNLKGIDTYICEVYKKLTEEN